MSIYFSRSASRVGITVFEVVMGDKYIFWVSLIMSLIKPL